MSNTGTCGYISRKKKNTYALQTSLHVSASILWHRHTFPTESVEEIEHVFEQCCSWFTLVTYLFVLLIRGYMCEIVL
jgi:hypothetical protein